MAKMQMDSGIIPRENLISIIKIVGGGAAILAFGIFSIYYFVPRVPPVTKEQIARYDVEAARLQLTPTADCSNSNFGLIPGQWFDEKLNFQRCYEGVSLDVLNSPVYRVYRMVAQDSSRDAIITITQQRAMPGYAVNLVTLKNELPSLGLTEQNGVKETESGQISTNAISYFSYAKNDGHGVAFTMHESPIPMGSQLGYRNAIVVNFFDSTLEKPITRDMVANLFSMISIKFNPS